MISLNPNPVRLLPLAHAAAAAAGLLLCGGCASSSGSADGQGVARDRNESARAFQTAVASGHQKVSIQELDQLAYGYADRYYMVISSAVDALKSDNADPMQR